MKYRKLRMAWSVGWGILALLLCFLLIRSYYVCDYVFRRGSPTVITSTGSPTVITTVALNRGMVHVIDAVVPAGSERPSQGWQYSSRDASDSLTIVRWMWGANGGGGTSNPISFVVFLTAAISAVSWIPWRFSLRTLLIGMTLVAVVLGLVAWAAD